MKFSIRRRLAPLVIALASLAFAPLAARAQSNNSDNTPKDYDGRLDDFGQTVTLDGGGTTLSYFLFAGLGVLAIGILFKSANRSHLD